MWAAAWKSQMSCKMGGDAAHMRGGGGGGGVVGLWPCGGCLVDLLVGRMARGYVLLVCLFPLLKVRTN